QHMDSQSLVGRLEARPGSGRCSDCPPGRIGSFAGARTPRRSPTMRVPRFLAACVAAAALGSFAGAQGAPGADLEARIAALVRDSGIPSASVAVVQHGEIVYARAFGKAALAPERPADASTRYFVGSISKQFTSAAILLASEDGKLSLDDPVSRFYPGLTRAGDITIRELLGYSSGYEDFAPQDYLI